MGYEMAPSLVGMHQVAREEGHRAKGYHDWMLHLLRQVYEEPFELLVFLSPLKTCHT